MGIGALTSRAAVFLDRDGVINRNVFDPATGEHGAPRCAEDFEVAPGAIEALRELQRAGFALFLVSNQPDYAKGKCSLEDLEAVHARLLTELATNGVVFTEFYRCYHHPRGIVPGFSGVCECRKPQPYFLFKARDTFGISLPDSWMVGDRGTDVECGRAAGVRTIRVAEDHPAVRSSGEPEADYQARDLSAAAAILLKESAATV